MRPAITPGTHHWQESRSINRDPRCIIISVTPITSRRPTTRRRFYSETPDEGPVEQWRKYNLEMPYTGWVRRIPR